MTSKAVVLSQLWLVLFQKNQILTRLWGKTCYCRKLPCQMESPNPFWLDFVTQSCFEAPGDLQVKLEVVQMINVNSPIMVMGHLYSWQKNENQIVSLSYRCHCSSLSNVVFGPMPYGDSHKIIRQLGIFPRNGWCIYVLGIERALFSRKILFCLPKFVQKLSKCPKRPQNRFF